MNRTLPVPTTPRAEHHRLCGRVTSGVPHHGVASEGLMRATADVLVIGGALSLLVPVVGVLDGCDWTVRYQAGADTAVEWLRTNRTYVAVIEVDQTWREPVARLRQTANCGRIILATPLNLPLADVLNAGAYYALRVPFDAYDLRWSVVTARREAQSEPEELWTLP